MDDNPVTQIHPEQLQSNGTFEGQSNSASDTIQTETALETAVRILFQPGEFRSSTGAGQFLKFAIDFKKSVL